MKKTPKIEATRQEAEARYIASMKNALDALDLAMKHGADTSRMAGHAFFLSGKFVPRMASDRHVFSQAICQARAIILRLKSIQANPPDWFVDAASRENIVPWLMVNGKPDADFPDYWGRAISRRGKAQFTAPQTRAVSAAIKSVDADRKACRSLIARRPDSKYRSLNAAMKHLRGRRPTPMDEAEAEILKLAELLPLSHETKDKWWPLVWARIKVQPHLTERERKSIRAAAEYDTEASMLKEYKKRCRKAFTSLCP